MNDPVKGWALAAAPSDVVIVVALNGGDLAAIRPVLRDELFFPSLQNAIAAVPDDFAGPPLVIDAHNGSAQPPNPSLPTCDCADVDLKVCKKDHRQIVGETPATVIKMGQPQFPEEARLANVVRATIGIHLKVNAAGLPTFLWISKAAGYGLDENVAVAIGSSKFKPATCHGQPVLEDHYIEFNVER